jgi:hypothetical protein
MFFRVLTSELFVTVAFGHINVHGSKFHRVKIYIYIVVLKWTKRCLALNHVIPLTGFVKSHQLATDLLVLQEQTGIHVLTHALTQRLVLKYNHLSLEKTVV